MSGDFKDAIIGAAVTPDRLGKAFIVSCLFVFAAGVLITSNERDHDELRQLQKNNAMQISSTAAEFLSVTLQIQEIKTTIEKDQEMASERRSTSANDRARIESAVNRIIERLNE